MARVNLSGRAIFQGCIPVTWFTPYTGESVNHVSGPLRQEAQARSSLRFVGDKVCRLVPGEICNERRHLG